MRFRVLKKLDWAGLRYPPMAIIDIDENHPRIGALVRTGFVVYDAGLPGPGDRKGEPIVAKSA